MVSIDSPSSVPSALLPMRYGQSIIKLLETRVAARSLAVILISLGGFPLTSIGSNLSFISALVSTDLFSQVS